MLLSLTRKRWNLLILFLIVFSVRLGAQDRTGKPAQDPELVPIAESTLGNDLPDIRLHPPDKVLDNPTQDGWDTEAFTGVAEKQLKRLSAILAGAEKLDTAHLQGLVTAGFTSASPVPKKLQSVFQDQGIEVFRPEGPPGKQGNQYRGVAGMVKALKVLLKPFRTYSDLRAEFKVFRVDVEGGLVTTRQYFSLSGLTEGGSREVNAAWRIGWLQSSDEDFPRIDRIDVESYEHIVVRSPNQTLFADCTEAVLGHNASFREHLTRGMNYWMPRIQWGYGVDELASQGLAVGDVNGDELEDVYVCQSGGLPNRLFIQNQDGTASDVSETAGVDFLDLTRSALLIDVDNDGDQDLLLTHTHELVFMANDGKGNFVPQRRMRMKLPMLMGLSAADYDHDGDLDIYVCVYSGTEDRIGALGTPIPFHDANNGGGNVLLRNDGNWHFNDVTHQVGLDQNNTRWSFTASWEDFDNDGDLDLYVANDFGRNNLYRNDGGRFVDVAAAAGVEDIATGMSVSWSDYNRDGLMDVYIANMFSSAGGRVTYQRQFKANTDSQTRAEYQGMARGNTLFENGGEGSFRDVSVDAGVTMGRWAWGSLFRDLNNDGWDDLLVVNGYITNEKTEDL